MDAMLAYVQKKPYSKDWSQLLVPAEAFVNPPHQTIAAHRERE
jgi:hypothetical protein